MYNGGEELGAVVVDAGLTNCRIGFAGEDRPRYYESWYESKSNQSDFISQLESVVDSALKTKLGNLNSAEHPVLLTETCGAHNRQQREILTELFFEKYDAPALFITNTAVLSAFANAKSSGVVVDIGGKKTTVAVVQDGYVVNKSIQSSTVAGDYLDQFLLQQLLDQQVLQGKPVTYDMPDLAWTDYKTLTGVRELKEAVCRVADSTFEGDPNIQLPNLSYQLPDGTMVHMGNERFVVPEKLFFAGSKTPTQNECAAIPKMICDAIAKCESDSNRELFHNVILCGGSSAFENMQFRLEREVSLLASPMMKVKVIAANPNERKMSSFLGGSILASLGSFHEMWISKEEYAEHGVSLVQRKCP